MLTNNVPLSPSIQDTDETNRNIAQSEDLNEVQSSEVEAPEGDQVIAGSEDNNNILIRKFCDIFTSKTKLETHKSLSMCIASVVLEGLKVKEKRRKWKMKIIVVGKLNLRHIIVCHVKCMLIILIFQLN